MKRTLCTVLLGSCCSGLYAQNLIDNYLTGTPTYTVIANASNQISQPRDLDFKPFTNELWIINRGNSNGGSNVIIFNAGESNQSTQYRKDSHSGHFMIFPSGIAFGDNGEFANSNEVLNTNPNSATFMGPALWSSDTSIFARIFQNNWLFPRPLGSHLDMLHQSPFSMGIAHDSASTYWVFDGHNGNLCKYDFGMHHSPGYDDHSNGKIWRYSDITLTRTPNVPGHLIKDKATGWLYIVDAGAKKLKRVHTNTGTITGTLSVPGSAAEPLSGYSSVTGATVQLLDSFNTSQPSGIDLYNGRLIVGDNANGDIHVYDITGTNPVKLGVIATGQTDMMGLKIGHDGKIWFVNHTLNTVVRIDPSAGVSNDVAVVAITAPVINNFETHYYHPGFNHCSGSITPVISIRNTGTNALTSATINYKIDNGSNNTFNWTGMLASGASTSVTLPAINVTDGTHKLMVEAVNPNGVADANAANNIKAGSFRTLNPSASYPFSESFTNNTFPPAGWSYLSHNFHNEMSHNATAGGGSVKMDNYSGHPDPNREDITGQRDYLLTPKINFTNANSQAHLSFKVAYARYNNNTNDALTVLISTDCGQTWTQLYNKSGATLATAPNTSSAFTPSASEWRIESIPLAAYAGMQDIMFQFLATSGYGNNLYLDDIAFSNTVSVSDQNIQTFTLYPNPAKDKITVEGIKTDQPATVSVFDVMGKLVKTISERSTNGKIIIDIADLSSGNYVLKIVSGQATQQQKISVVK